MSFNRLPTEIKQLIVDQAAYSDQAYRKRISSLDDTGSVSSSKENVRGRCLDALSKVGKEVRELCYIHLFSVLQVSRCLYGIFQRTILDSPISKYITTLDIDSHVEIGILSFALFHICPRLPNLSSITFSNQHSHSLINSDSQSAISDEKRDTTAKFFQLAKRVSSWDLRFNGAHQILPYLSANPSTITSLSLRAVDGAALLESAELQIPNALAKLPSLRNLSFSFAPTSESLVYPSSLEISYSFANILQSLSFTIPSNSIEENLDVNLLRFAALFPTLTELRINFIRLFLISRDASSSIVLPQLKTLKLRCYDISPATDVLGLLHLPEIVYIRLEFDEEYELAYDTQSGHDVHVLASRLAPFAATLRVLEVIHPIGMYGTIWLFVDMVFKKPLELRKSWIDGQAEAEGDQETLDEEYRSRLHVSDVLGDAVADLARWAADEATRLGREGDFRKVQEMWNEMKGINEMRQYSKD